MTPRSAVARQPSADCREENEALTTTASSRLNLESLFQAHQQELVGRLRRLVGCWHLAADLVQDAYVRLLRMRDQQDISHPRAFLHRTAVNLALDHLRKQRHRASVYTPFEEANAVPSPEPTAPQAVYDKQRLAAFQGAVQSLPATTRDVLVLRRIHGHTHEEIANQLGLSKRQVENLLAKALYHCQKALPERSTL